MTAAEESLRAPTPVPAVSAGDEIATPLGAFDAYAARVIAPPVVAGDRDMLVALALAIGIGAVTDALFHGAMLGMNVTLWFAALALAIALGARATGRGVSTDRALLLGLSVALASIWAWRDAGPLLFFSLVGALGALALAAGLPTGRSGWRTTPLTLALAGLNMAAAGATAWLRIARALRWRDLLSGPARARAEAMTRAIAIALPLLLIFGLLFAAADAVFAQALSALVLPDDVVAHAFLLLFGYGIGAALLWPTLCVRTPEQPEVPAPTTHALGVTEIAIVLGSLALLFTAFVVVQLRYLFGGVDAVQTSVDLTYAEYARRGYFELVTASLLLLPVLASLDWARRREGTTRTLYLVLTTALTVLLFVVMASAWQRLAIYRETFGLTEARLYTAVSLAWLGATLLWFLLLVVCRATDRALAGAVTLAVACLLALAVLSPDAYIVRTNLERAAAGHELDVAYAASLSADAVPALLASLPALEAAADSEVARCTLALRFARSIEAEAQRDWRGWNYARDRGARLVAAQGAMIPPLPAGCELPRED